MTNEKSTNSQKPHDLPIEDASNADGQGAADKATSDGGSEPPAENGATDGVASEDVNSTASVAPSGDESQDPLLAMTAERDE
jgi:hypothetical protein